VPQGQVTGLPRPPGRPRDPVRIAQRRRRPDPPRVPAPGRPRV